jgi:hypothetical protein
VVEEPATGLPEPASRQALAVLRSLDTRSPWVVVLAATLSRPAGDLDAALAELHAAVPLIGARLRGASWHAGPPPSVARTAGDPIASPAIVTPFDLANEAPLRVVAGDDGTRLAVAAHHAAFDGRSLALILSALLGGPPPMRANAPDAPPGGRGRLQVLRRVLPPADRIAPSTSPPEREVFAARPVNAVEGSVTTRLAVAAVEAAGARNRALRKRWKRVGLSVAVGGPPGIGNVATYRRIDFGTDESVGDAVQRALTDETEQPEMVGIPGWARLFAPFAPWFSDSLLVSNIGRVDLPNTERIEFYPVARGRSAVAFGAAALASGAATISIRARDLVQPDAEALLTAVARRFEAR